MKTIFKRAAATATGSVLLLSQLAATAVVNLNVAAADVKTMDKAWVVDVPIEETLKVTEITDGTTVNEITSSIEAGESQWNKDFEAAILAIAGSGAVTSTVSAADFKKPIENALASTAIIDAATAAELAAAISDEATVTVDDGAAVVTIAVDEAGPAVGNIIEELVRRGGGALKDDEGNAIAIDWSSFSVKGTLTVNVTYTYDKNIAYAVSFTDEKGAVYTVDTIGDYISAKIDEAGDVIVAAIEEVAAEYGVTDVTVDVDEFLAKAENYPTRLANALNKVFGVSVSNGTDLEETYADYIAALEAQFGARVVAQVEKRTPASIINGLYNEKADAKVDAVISALNNIAGDKADINITATDLADILTSGYDYNINIPNGYSAALVFSIEDDQNEDLLAALQEIDPLVATVVSHKEITLRVGNNTDGSGKFYYNVVRVIDVITKTAETTTTTTTTEETTTTTTTEETGDTTTTTTTTEETGDTTTTTTTTEGTGNSTTTTTETTGEGSGTTTTTTPAPIPTYDIQINAEGLNVDNLIYWSEEDTEFDLSGLKVTADILVDGELATTIDITAAYAADATKPSDFEFLGLGSYTINVVLVDAAVVEAAITAAGYDVADFDANVIAEGTIPAGGQATVTLVLRGDITLDNKLTIVDALGALQYYADYNSKLTPATTIETGAILKDQDGDVSYLPYLHYAADVRNGNGRIELSDAYAILTYYTDNNSHLNPTWEGICGSVVVPQNVLHADPFAFDDIAKDFYEKSMG